MFKKKKEKKNPHQAEFTATEMMEKTRTQGKVINFNSL